jgi:hypothetical protein
MKSILILFISITALFSNTNRITTSDGITCESTSDAPYEFESYVEGSNSDYDSDSFEDGFDNNDNNNKTMGIRFTYKFGQQKSLNCNRLYNLELRAKKAKVLELEEKIKALEMANKINWNPENEN